MSGPGGREALEAFHNQFMAPLDDEPAGLSSSKAVGREVASTLYGSPTERALTAVVESVQESGLVPYAAAGVVSVSSVLGPVAATAQTLTHGVGTRVAEKVRHVTGGQAETAQDATFTWEPGDTVYREAELHMGEMRVSLSTAEGEIEAESGIDPDQVGDIQVGTEGKIPVNPDIAVVIAGQGEAQTAAEHGETAAEIERDNPSPDPNFVLVGAHLRLESQAAPKPATTESSQPVSKIEHHAEPHSVPVRPRTEDRPRVAEPAEPHAKPQPKAPPKLVAKPAAKPRPKATTKAAPTTNTTTTPISKPKVPSVSIAKPKTERPAVPKKSRVTIAPQPGVSFGNGLQNELGQAFLSVRGSVATESHHIKMNTIHGAASMIKKLDESLDQPSGSNAHKATHHARAAQNGGECTSTGNIAGKTKQQKAMNFFVVCEGYSTSQAAGVVGNLMQESHLEPEAIQNGGESQDPADAGANGWGIAQWTPGSKASSVTKQYGIRGPIYRLQTQLVMVGEQLKHESPTGQIDTAKDLKHASSTDQAAQTMEGEFEEGKQVAESGGGQLSDREQFAQEALSGYRATNLGAMAVRGIGSHRHHRYRVKQHPSGPRHIRSSSEIYYEALKFNPDSYSETMIAGHEGWSQWKKNFPTMGPKALIDCSGLVDMVTASITDGRYNVSNNTVTILRDTRDWQREPEADAGRGDLIEPVIGGKVGVHIEIVKGLVDHGRFINTFGAHTDAVPQPNQVSPAQYTYNPKDIFLRYIGPGAPLLPHSSTTHVAGHRHKPHKPHHTGSNFSLKGLVRGWDHPLGGHGL